MENFSLDVIRGTLDLLILKTLSWHPLHGYAISQVIKNQTDSALLVEEGALYPALYRMEAKGWIEATWASRKTTAAQNTTSSRPMAGANSESKPKPGSVTPRQSRKCWAPRESLTSRGLDVS